MPGTPFSPMVGTLVGVNVLFVDETGAPADPTTIIIQAKKPDGSLADVTVTNLGVGIYRGELIVTVPGQWVVQAKGLGALIVTEEASFTVRRQALG